MAKQQNNEEQLLLETIGKAESFLEKNKNVLIYGIGGLALLILGIVYMNTTFLPEREAKAQKDMFMAQFAFDKDSFDLALNGSGKDKGFFFFFDGGMDYMFTSAKSLAAYQAGICYLQLGKFDKAIEYLERFSSSEDMVQSQAYCALGDAYAEKGDMSKACSYYKKAANGTKNEVLAPMFMFKAGMAFEANKDKEAALEMYMKLKKEFPTSEEGREIDKFILKVGGEI